MLRKSESEVVAAHVDGEMIEQLVDCIRQKQDLWCWAACIEMSLRRRNTNKRQCAIVATAFPELEDDILCCDDPDLCDCDCDPLELASKYIVNGVPATFVDGQMTLDDLRAEINVNKRPVAVCWEGTPKHVVLVVGVSATTNKVIVADPDESYFTTAPMSYAQLQKPEGRAPDSRWRFSWKA